MVLAQLRLALLFVATAVAARTAQAIPAFARAHDYSCNVCHAPIPKLTEFGEDFAGNAFAPSDAPLPPRYFKDVGDDRLALLRHFPIAVRADFYLDAALPHDDADQAEVDLKTPFGLKLLSGGRLAKDLGYYFYFYMNEHGEVAGIEDAYLHFNDVGGTPLDVMVGQFQISDPMLKRELRLTFQDYLLYKFRPGNSVMRLTYDRGVMLSAGWGFGLDVVAMVVNGNGIGEGDLRQGLDSDRHKHGALRLSQSLGPVRVGVFGLYGREQQESGARRNNYTAVVGPDATVAVGPVELNLQYLWRRDTNPVFAARDQWQAVACHGLLAEVVWRVLGDPGQLYAVFLFNYVDSDELIVDSGDVDRRLVAAGNQEAYTLNLNYLLHTNVRLLAEYTFGWMVNGRELKEHRATVGAIAAF